MTDTTNTRGSTEQSVKPKATLFVADLEMRDYFAAAAMQGMMAYGTWSVNSGALCASSAYAIAEAMLNERNKS